MIQQWQAQQRTQQEDIEVWECNLPTVRIFQACTLSWVAGMGGAVCMGLPMSEIAPALDAFGVEREARPEIAAGLVLMGRVAARTINANSKRG